jgi:hypothetical protein
VQSPNPHRFGLFAALWRRHRHAQSRDLAEIAMRTVVFACPCSLLGVKFCAGAVAFSLLIPITAVTPMVLFLRRAKSLN